MSHVSFRNERPVCELGMPGQTELTAREETVFGRDADGVEEEDGN